jgi:hypothetical protein
MTVATTGVAVTTSSSPPSSPPSSSIEQYRTRSSSFGSITPTFSSDLAKLRAACSCGDGGDGNTTHAGNTTATAATTNGGVNKEPYVVHSYTKAIAIATTFDIFGPNSPLCQKLKLNNNKQRTTTTVEENENENKKVWIEFINQSGAAVVIGDKQQPFFDDNAGSNNDNNSNNNNNNNNNNNVNNNNDVNVAIQMEKLLRYCFDVAFKLPPSNGHVRTVSSSGRNFRLPPGPPML